MSRGETLKSAPACLFGRCSTSGCRSVTGIGLEQPKSKRPNPMTLQRPMFPPRETVPYPYSFSAPLALDPAAAAAPPPKPAKIGRRGLLLGLVAAGAPAAAGALGGRPREPDPVFAAIEAFQEAEMAFDPVYALAGLPAPALSIHLEGGEHA